MFSKQKNFIDIRNNSVLILIPFLIFFKFVDLFKLCVVNIKSRLIGNAMLP